MILVFVLFIFLIIIYYLYSIQLWRYTSLKSIDDVEYYDQKYNHLPRIKSWRKVVISMTTIPSRIDKLKPTLVSLFDSTYRVDKIYLNIPYYSLKGKKYIIPNWLKKCKNIEINWILKDLGPATKLLPVLKKEKRDTIIVVVDDDVIYGSNMIEQYISTFYERGEKEALTIFGSSIEKGKIVSEWPTFLTYRSGKYVSMVKGHNSFLVTPEMFPKHVFNYKIAPKECFWVDDVWFSGWLKYNGIKIYSLGFRSKNIPITNMELIEDSESLCTTQNINNKNNNIAIEFFEKNCYVKF